MRTFVTARQGDDDGHLDSPRRFEAMSTIVVRVERDRSLEADMNPLPLHQDRSRLLHSLAETLDLDVQDWGDTDDAMQHEWVDIQLDPGTVTVLVAMVSVVKVWMMRHNLTVEIRRPGGTSMKVKANTAEDIRHLTDHLDFRETAPDESRG